MQLLFQVSPQNVPLSRYLAQSQCLLQQFFRLPSCRCQSLCTKHRNHPCWFCLHALCIRFQVESNPFPLNYVANYTISTEVASMEFRTENGTHIPISGLDDSLAITVAVNNGSAGAETGPEGAATGGVPTAGGVNISFCDSVVVRVSMGNANRQAGLFVQLNFTSQQGERSLLELHFIFVAVTRKLNRNEQRTILLNNWHLFISSIF